MRYLLPKLFSKLLCLACTLLLFSCANHDNEQGLASKTLLEKGPEKNIDKEAKKASASLNIIPLLPVPTLLQNRVWVEKFTFSFTGKHSSLTNKFSEKSMLLQTELSAQGINLAAMSFSGALLAQASWLSGEQLITSEIGLAKDFNAEQVLHDLQLSHWPIIMLQENLYAGFSVTEQISADNTQVRHFYHHDEILIVIRYVMPSVNSLDNAPKPHIDFQHHKQGYQLSIQRLSESSLSRAESP